MCRRNRAWENAVGSPGCNPANSRMAPRLPISETTPEQLKARMSLEWRTALRGQNITGTQLPTGRTAPWTLLTAGPRAPVLEYGWFLIIPEKAVRAGRFTGIFRISA